MGAHMGVDWHGLWQRTVDTVHGLEAENARLRVQVAHLETEIAVLRAGKYDPDLVDEILCYRAAIEDFNAALRRKRLPRGPREPERGTGGDY